MLATMPISSKVLDRSSLKYVQETYDYMSTPYE